MKKFGLLFVLVAAFTTASTAFAITDLGSGFKCDGTAIIKGTKTVSYTKAKSTVAATIQKLKDAKADATTAAAKAKIQAKLNAAKSAKTQITACSKGQLSATQVDPVFSNLASGSGTYTGPYSANVDIVGNIQGSFTVAFTLQETVFGGTLTATGPLNNALNSQPLAFSNDVGGIGFPAQFFLANTFLGNVTLSVTQSGLLTITNDVQSKAVNFSGQFANNAIAGSVNGVYSVPFFGAVSYSGTFNLAKQ